jgi:hypothetical protein
MRELKWDARQAGKVLAKMLAQSVLRRTGSKRGTRYFLAVPTTSDREAPPD